MDQPFTPALYPVRLVIQAALTLLLCSASANSQHIQQSFPTPNRSARVIAIDPTSPGTVYLGTLNGLFISVDSGREWTLLNGPPADRSITALAIDAASLTLFAGTYGGQYFRRPLGEGSWTPIAADFPKTFEYYLVVAPDRPSVLYGGGRGEIVYRSRDAGVQWEPLERIRDPYEAIPEHVGGATDIAINPTQPDLIYVAAHGFLWKSTDSGKSWTRLNVRNARSEYLVWLTELEINNAGELYIGYATAGQGDPGGVLKSMDGGASWEEIYFGEQVWALAATRSSSTQLYIATGSKFISILDEHLGKSPSE